MPLFTHLDRLKRLDSFIRRKATGKPDELASRLEMSRSTLFRHIEDLRALGAKITYDKERETYRYEEPFDLKF